jgi:hypothetical protein
MCDKCKQIDDRIDHFRKMASYVMDRPVLDSFAIAIANLEAEKAALHPKA